MWTTCRSLQLSSKLKKVKFKRRKMNSMTKEERPNKYTMRMALTVEEGDVVSNDPKEETCNFWPPGGYYQNFRKPREMKKIRSI